MQTLRTTASLVVCVLGGFVASSSSAQPPSATKTFFPDVIGPGSVTTLEILITNPDPLVPATDLAVSDTLPAGMTIASTPFASTSCSDATLSAPAGGGVISLSDGRLGAGDSCEISVDVTVGSAGAFVNTTGDVTSSAGNGGTATDTLTGDAARGGFSLEFSPSTIPLGGTSTITYTIDLTVDTFVTSATFSNDLPEGLVVADPPNASSDCTAFGVVPTIDANSGTGSISFNGTVDPPVTCTVEVDVTANIPGEFANRTSVLFAASQSSGFASGTLNATVDTLNLGAFFSGDPVAPGETLQLDFTISNFNRDGAATNIAFTDDVDETLSGLSAVGLPVSDVCGAGSMLSGTDILTFTGGSLGSGESCEFSVTLAVPAAAAPGRYTNTTSTVTADIAGEPEVGSAVSDFFDVAFVPRLEKSFITDPVGAGQSTDLEFTITNTSATLAMSDIAFTNQLDEFIPGIVTFIPVFPPPPIVEGVVLPADGFCGPGSSMEVVSVEFEQFGLEITGASLSGADSCTFQVTIDIPAGTPGGTYTNESSPITAVVDGDEVVGPPASADLTVVSAPKLRKSFAEDRVGPGDEVTLEFTLLHLGEDLPGSATDIEFTDDLEAMLTGLVATGLPMSDVCGSGSELSGTSELSFTGGTLEPDTECTFSVTLQVPAETPPGVYDNTTNNVTAMSAGLSVTGNAAEDSLEVSNLTVTKSFVDDPVVAGTQTTLDFTITNEDPDLGATSIQFSDDLDDVLSGLTAIGLPLSDVCGAGSSLVGSAGDTVLTLFGGNIGPDSACAFGITLQTPPGALADTYTNVTSNVTAIIGGVPVFLSPATDTLEIIDALTMTKAFAEDAVAPGSTVDLEFTIENAHPLLPAEDLAFTDDLDAALSGLVATGLPADDVCGIGSQVSGTDVITLSGGMLEPESSCTFSVTLQVPSEVAVGSIVENITSELSGNIDEVATTGEPAADQLTLSLATLSKAFESSAAPGATTMLTFTVENLSASALPDLDFADDLDAALSGLASIDTPINDVCGVGSVLSGDSVVTLRGGTLEAESSCTFGVTVEVPTGAAADDYENVTTELTSSGVAVADAATATLTVDETVTDGGVDGGADGGPGPGGGGGCGCRTTGTSTSPLWWLVVLGFGLGWAIRRRRVARRHLT